MYSFFEYKNKYNLGRITMENGNVNTSATNETRTKFCKFCGTKIAEDAVICTACGRQVEELKGAHETQATPNIIINNANTNSNVNNNVNNNGRGGRPKNKWVALLLCLLLGFFGAHKFYEGKVGMGILYIFTGGLFFIGVIIDFIAILAKPNPYYV